MVTTLTKRNNRNSALLDATDSNSVAKTYTWGLDLSGDLQGACGVGGLLSTSEIFDFAVLDLSC